MKISICHTGASGVVPASMNGGTAPNVNQIEISSVVNISIISVRTITPSQIQNISDFFVNNFGKRGDSDTLWRALSIEIAFKQECAEVRECVNVVFVTYIARN